MSTCHVSPSHLEPFVFWWQLPRMSFDSLMEVLNRKDDNSLIPKSLPVNTLLQIYLSDRQLMRLSKSHLFYL